MPQGWGIAKMTFLRRYSCIIKGLCINFHDYGMILLRFWMDCRGRFRRVLGGILKDYVRILGGICRESWRYTNTYIYIYICVYIYTCVYECVTRSWAFELYKEKYRYKLWFGVPGFGMDSKRIIHTIKETLWKDYRRIIIWYGGI